MDGKIGLLLVNLGSPQSYSKQDVKRYLIEFLTDGRVIDLPWFQRQCLVRGIIIPRRYKESAKLYESIWTEEGAPLIVYGRQVAEKLQALLGDGYQVELAMRYQFPSIQEGLDKLHQGGVKEIIVLPLFPQYASSTTGSIHQKVMEIVQGWETIPKLTLINSFADHPGFINAVCQQSKQFDLASYDHILFSFHGLPERQVYKASPKHGCLQGECCRTICHSNQFCYQAHCHATTKAVASGLALHPDRYTICFQSRLGNDPWIRPYTAEVLEQRAKCGDRRLLVFCPAFVCDCLETTSEIGHEYADQFKQLGGETLDLVPGLNSHPAWIEALRSIVINEPIPVKFFVDFRDYFGRFST